LKLKPFRRGRNGRQPFDQGEFGKRRFLKRGLNFWGARTRAAKRLQGNERRRVTAQLQKHSLKRDAGCGLKRALRTARLESEARAHRRDSVDAGGRWQRSGERRRRAGRQQDGGN